MRIHRSNRLERLALSLAEVVAVPPRSPLSQETIVVQSKGMERWLLLNLASHFGVWANVDFPFPSAFVERLFDAVVPADRDASAFGRDALAWSIAAVLPDLAAQRPFEPVRRYLAHGAQADDSRSKREGPSLDDARLLELCRRIANVFDQYSVYRPELLLRWEAGEENDWQAILFRQLVARHGSCHFAARAQAFLEAWSRLDSTPSGLPERVNVFGISSLPPAFLRLLDAISVRIPVEVYCLSPTETFQTDAGAPLIQSLGRLGREFDEVLGTFRETTETISSFEPPGSSSLLRVLQSDLLAGRRRGPGDGHHRVAQVSATDDSITVHSCHGPMREVEVLRDQLLDAFERDPTLAPHDVVVMVPDVERYAPLIDAVFGVPAGVAGFVPYRIADRTLRSDNAIADAMVRLLSVLPGRMRATELCDLLDINPIRARFGIAEEEVPELASLVQQSGVRWGRDASHRAASGQPETDANTWQFGLRRLLLGYAMPGDGARLFEGTLPYDDVEGDMAEQVGRLAEFVTAVFACQQRLAAPRPVLQWVTDLATTIDAMMAADDRSEWQKRALLHVLRTLGEESQLSGFERDVSLEAMTRALSLRLSSERTAHDFLTGGVTFCALLPMRSVPFRVVYLLGQNDAEFPRTERPLGFDLIAQEPRAGDRSTREEDKYLFLEALVSARDRFCVSYVGRSAHDNAAYPPSVVVSDLLATIAQSFAAERPARQLVLLFDDSDATSPVLTIEHPLQPFSRRYFDQQEPRLFSYSTTDLDAARALQNPTTFRRRFHHEPLFATAAAAVTVEELVRFLENPARGLLQRQLGVFFEDEVERHEDREPAQLDKLDEYTVGSSLLTRALAGEDVRAALDTVRGHGVLPLGTPGQAAFERVLPVVEALERAAARYLGPTTLAPIEMEIEAGGVQVRGLLRDVYPAAQVRHQYARVRGKTLVGIWIRHLLLQCVHEDDYPKRTVLIGRPLDDKKPGGIVVRHFTPLPESEARAHLAELAQLYSLGQKAPLCFFPTLSLNYVTQRSKGRGPNPGARALEATRRKYQRPDAYEREDEYVRRLFADVDPFADSPVPFDEDGAIGMPSFARAADLVFGPLLQHSTLEDP